MIIWVIIVIITVCLFPNMQLHALWYSHSEVCIGICFWKCETRVEEFKNVRASLRHRWTLEYDTSQEKLALWLSLMSFEPSYHRQSVTFRLGGVEELKCSEPKLKAWHEPYQFEKDIGDREKESIDLVGLIGAFWDRTLICVNQCLARVNLENLQGHISPSIRQARRHLSNWLV